MNLDQLAKTANQMVAENRGLLAADESTGTIGKRFAQIDVENVEDNRRDYRELLFRAEGLGKFISGVILYDETLRQSAADGSTLASLMEGQGIIPGIKVDMGAKEFPGSPGEKVTEEIAAIRFIDVGKPSISPNRHPDVNSGEELLDLVARVRTVTGKPTGFKCVVGAYGWLEELCEEIHRRGIESAPDFITVDSADGGSGAAPMSLMDYMGLPLKESLPLVVDILCRQGLKERIFLVASGKLITPGEVAWALCAGADFVVTARGFMFALGCIQALQCNRNTCPTGVTTHDIKLQRGLDPTDKAERVYQYAKSVRKEVGVIAHSCGVPEPARLRRFHCRVVQAQGGSRPLDVLYPDQLPQSPP